jgi:hypothetical protein
MISHSFWTVTVILAGLLISAPASDAAAVRPNFVLVYIDDMGWGDFLSCFLLAIPTTASLLEDMLSAPTALGGDPSSGWIEAESLRLLRRQPSSSCERPWRTNNPST